MFADCLEGLCVVLRRCIEAMRIPRARGLPPPSFRSQIVKFSSMGWRALSAPKVSCGNTHTSSALSEASVVCETASCLPHVCILTACNTWQGRLHATVSPRLAPVHMFAREESLRGMLKPRGRCYVLPQSVYIEGFGSLRVSTTVHPLTCIVTPLSHNSEATPGWT